MLNESFALARALQKAGIRLEAQHPMIRVPARSTGPVIRVCLDAAGAIVRCEGVVAENHDRLWTYLRGTSSGSFPVTRLAEPLWAAPEEEPRDKRKSKPSAAQRRKALKDRLASAQPGIPRKKTLDMFVRLRDWAETLAKILEGQSDDIAQVCRAYLEVVPRSAKVDEAAQSVPLLDALREYAAKWLNVCDDTELDALEVLLFTASSKPRQKAQLAWDVDDISSTIYHAGARKMVTRAFLDNDAKIAPPTANSADHSAQVCAYSGSTDLLMESFPKVKVPLLGEVSLFSMNPDAECNRRYGRKGHELLPVSRNLVLNMLDSLKEIVHEARKGRTWRPIASEKPKNSDLLIVYVDGQPDISADVADMFGESADTQGKQFNVVASAVCDALDGVKQQQPDSRLSLFILRKVSEGQTLVVLSETPTVEEVLKGAEWWQAAARNVPIGKPDDEYVVELSVLNKEKKQEWRRPPVPYPGQVAALLTEAQKGRGRKLRGVAFSEVLDVMLQKPGKAEAAAMHILSLCVKHAGPLLRGLAGCQGRGSKDKDWKVYSDKDPLSALRAVSTIGIALYALGSRREDYMHEAAFQVGRVLALADRLHRCYCAVVRDGSMPPNLIGNAVFSAALDSPEKALATLGERIRIYQGWARTAEPTSDEKGKRIAVWEAKKVLRLYEPLATELHRQGVPQRCDDVMKAHLLLGYLAGEESEEKPEGEDE